MKKSHLLFLVLGVGMYANSFAESQGPPVWDVTIVDSQVTVEYRYVGLTSHEDDGQWEYAGLAGIVAMNKACADDFGFGARAATIADAMFKTDSDKGWVVPGSSPIVSLQNGIPVDSATGYIVGKIYGSDINAIYKSYCRRYSDPGDDADSGAAVGIGGGEVIEDCSSVLPAVCSAPFAIPVRIVE